MKRYQHEFRGIRGGANSPCMPGGLFLRARGEVEAGESDARLLLRAFRAA